MLLLSLALAMAGAEVSFPAPKLMTPAELQATPAKPADRRIAYGGDPNQFGELRVPSGAGPHPVVVLIHGGCFRAELATLSDLSPMANALKAEGVASWNIEYRRLGQAGGGWPGTYQDVGRGLDHLRTLAARYDLDLGRVVVVGHSAGGHLALWAASRAKLPASSPIGGSRPLGVRGVVDLGGPPDLRDNVEANEKTCGRPVNHEMLGGDPAKVQEQARATASVERLPLGVAQVLVLGEHDDSVPRPIAQTYVAKAKAAGDPASLLIVPGVGHFETASPATSAWAAVRSAILTLLDVKR